MARARGVGNAFAAALVVLWTAGVAGCGPGKGSGSGAGPTGGSGPPSGDTGGGTGGSGGTAGTTGPSGSSGGTTSGGGSSGGTASGGTPGGDTSGGTSGSTGGTDSGGTAGGTSSGGASSGGASSGGTSSGGSSGGGSSGGSSSGTSSGGGSAANPCDGLVPAQPDAGRLLRITGNCTNADSRTDGQVALGVIGPQYLQEYLLYTPDGSTQQGSIPLILGIGPGGSGFHATGPGWAGIVHDIATEPPPQALRSWDTTGNQLGTAGDYAVSSAPDGHGGTVMLAHPVSAGPFATSPTLIEWLDGSSRVLRTVTLDANPTLLLVDWNTDHVLTLVPGGFGGRLSARWYDGAGTPLTPWFDAGPGVMSPSVHLLVDGSIALADGGTWVGAFRDGVASRDAPPAWLAARPGTQLATIRDGRGYAVLPLPYFGGTTPDQTAFEIVTPSGESCGKVQLPPDPAAPGVTVMRAVALDVGQDGTVFQTAPIGGPALPNNGTSAHCEWRWWPGLLR